MEVQRTTWKRLQTEGEWTRLQTEGDEGWKCVPKEGFKLATKKLKTQVNEGKRLRV